MGLHSSPARNAIAWALAISPVLVAQEAGRPRELCATVAAFGQLVDPNTGTTLPLKLRSPRAPAIPFPQRPRRFLIGDELLDLRPGIGTLTVTADHIEYRRAEALTSSTLWRFEPAWRVELTALRIGNGLDRTDCLVEQGVAVIPRFGGVIALDLATGGQVWSRDRTPGTLLVPGGAVLYAAGRVPERGVELHAISLRNGATLFETQVPDFDAMPSSIVPGPGGIALVSESSLTVVDLAGPILFTLPVRPLAIAPAADGWFACVDGELVHWDRDGVECWRRGLVTAENAERVELCGLPDGDVIVVAWSATNVDEIGVWRYDARDGRKVFWVTSATVRLPAALRRARARVIPTPVDHHAYATIEHDRFVVVGQTSWGFCLSVRDLATGAEIRTFR